MSNKKFSVEIHGRGEFNDAIIKMITNHNEGLVEIDLSLILAHCKCVYAQWPITTNEVKVVDSIGNGRELNIYEGKEEKHTLTITEKEIFELDETEKEPPYKMPINSEVQADIETAIATGRFEEFYTKGEL